MKRPGSVFKKGFLKTSRDVDESFACSEAMLSGEWKIIEREGVFVLYREWEDESVEPPFATFKWIDHAHLFAAVAPLTFRPAVYEAIREENRHLLFCADQVVGTFRWEPDEIVDVLNVAADLIRSPSALAYLLQAAGPSAIEAVGRLLHQRMMEEHAHREEAE